MKTRNSTIELFRVLFSIGVIILHYNNIAFEYVRGYGSNHIYLLFSEALSVGAVNYFVIVSGMYLSQNNNRKLIKIVLLLTQASVFNMTFYFGSVIMGEPVTAKGVLGRIIPESYFVILYCCLYLISPYINLVLERLDNEAFKRLIIILFLLFSVLSYVSDVLSSAFDNRFLAINPVSATGGSLGGSIVNFILLYVIGAYIAKFPITVERKQIVLITCVSMIMLFGLSLICSEYSYGNTILWSYSNPVIIIFVLGIVILIKNYSFYNKTINELSGAVFTCYLFHANWLPYLGIRWAVIQKLPILIAHQMVVCMAVFLSSYVVYKIYTVCTEWIVRILTPICNRIDISVRY